jgi:hypothetical protein
MCYDGPENRSQVYQISLELYELIKKTILQIQKCWYK